MNLAEFPLEVREDLEKSGISDALVKENGVRCIPPSDIAKIIGGNKASQVRFLVEFPYHYLNGDGPFSRYRLYPSPLDREGKPQKYHQIAGTAAHLYIPKSVSPNELEDPSAPLLIAEGEKKTLAACKANLGPAVGVSGVWGWVHAGRPTKDLDRIPLHGRKCLLCFDSDVFRIDKLSARQGVYAFAKELEARGAQVEFVLFSDDHDGRKIGLDDFLQKHSPAELLSLPRVSTSDQKHFKGLRSWWRSWKADQPAKNGPDIYEDVARLIIEANIETPIIYIEKDGFYKYTERGFYRSLSKEMLSVMIRCGISAYQKKANIEKLEASQSLRREIEEAMRDVLLKEHHGIELNKSSGILNVQNGLLDLSTMRLSAHRPESYFTLQFNAKYDAGASCPSWLRTLDEIFANDEKKTRTEKIEILRRFFGLCLVPDQSFQKILVLIGEGANGKSLLLSVLMDILGRENYSSVALDQLTNNFYLCELQNKLVNIASEISAKNPVSDSMLKRLSGEDSITADRKHQHPVKFFSFARLVFSMNEIPLIEDRTHAFYRRILVIEFTRTFSEQEQCRNLRERLLAERDGIFLWMLGGLLDLRKDGRFLESDAVRTAVLKFRRENNTVLAFSEEWLEPCEIRQLTKGSVYAAYKEWCERNGKKPFAANKFSQLLQKAMPTIQDGRITGGTRVWDGVSFSAEVEPSMERRFASGSGE